MRQYIALGIVILLVVVAGCSDGGGDGGNPDGTQANGADGGDGAFGSGGGNGDGSGGGGGDGGDGGGFGGGDGSGAGGFGSVATCQAGESVSSTDPQTGQTVTWQVEGMVTYEGRDVCKATWETSGSSQMFARGEMYFDPDGDYRKIVYRDGEGNVVFEFDFSGGMNGTAGMGNVDINGSMGGMNFTMPAINGTGMNYTMPEMNVTMPEMNVTMPETNYTMPG